MKVFPVVERELRAASRRKGTYWVRFLAAGVGMVIAAWILLVSRDSLQAHTLSRTIFIAISVFAFIYCLFAGVRNTADCISEERREGTLGLLFLTDLKAFEILFGKLAATSLNSLYGLVAIFPVLALPLLLGGMTFQEYGAMLLLLLNTLFLSLAAGLYVSSSVQGERAAMCITIALLVFLCGGWTLIGWILVEKGMGGVAPAYDWLAEAVFGWVSPILAFSEFLGSLGKSNISEEVWFSLMTSHVVAWLLILMAQRKLPRIWQDKAETIRGLQWKQRWKTWSHGTSQQRSAYRGRLLDESPTFWLGSRNRLKPAMVWAVLGLLSVLWLWGLMAHQNEWLDELVYILTGLTLTTVLKVWVAIEAAHCFNHDRHSGALELLLSTPLEVPEIVRGQFQALKRQFLWPTVAVLVVHFLFIISEKASGGMVTWWLATMAMLVADLLAISYIGMWLGLNRRHATRASGAALARILILPWVVLIGFFTLVGITGGFNGAARAENLFMGTWLLAGFGINLFFGLRAWHGLHDQMRVLASSRFDAPGGGEAKG